ncbi:uncharacterized protein P884DRAFT_271744 [Thermothelomyces heterothallicus CBS 202.75]|uniref:uncharacterized protein n=1 Tax=Thermothelomyces heterothallicus CBS 202.75 TaxID=1149848 RepID=UPI00374460A1
MHPLGGSLGLAGLLGLAVASQAAQAAQASRLHHRFGGGNQTDRLTECLTEAGVPVDVAGTADYAIDVSSFNRRLNYTPAAVAAAGTAEHVRDAVACAARLGVKATAKCGGHSYASFGLGGEDGHLVVEMSRMNRVVLDNETGIATVEGGTRLGHLAVELWDQGKRAISHGTCPGVGVGGHVLHGGYGMSSHTHGLALDWMVGATVVLANASVVECSATENPDLFWALRGAGSSMGVVTEFRFETFVPPENLTYFVATAQWPTEDRALAGLAAVQEYAKTMPAELNMRLYIAKRFVNLEGLYYGGKAALYDTLAPLLDQANATLALAQTGGWLDQLKHFGGSNLDLGHGHEEHETFHSTSLYTGPLDEDRLRAFVGYWFGPAKNTTRSWHVQIDLHGGENSAVSAAAPRSTAYAHRDSLLLFLLYDRADRGEFPADGPALMDDFAAAVTAGLDPDDWGMYVNYPNPSLSQDDAQARYWGPNLARLRAVKKDVDPDDLFHYPQGILPA